MDWTSVVATWAPVMPMMLILLKAHRDVIYRIIPEEFSRVRDLMQAQTEESKLRHAEHIATMKVLINAIEGQNRPKKDAQDAPSRLPGLLKRGKTRQKKAPRKSEG